MNDRQATVNLLKTCALPNDWVEDFEHENGAYQNVCVCCGVKFIGHKRRTTCKACSDSKGGSQLHE